LCGLGHGVRVLSHVERAVDALSATVVADRLRDRRDVRLREGPAKWRAPVAAPAGADALGPIRHVRPSVVVVVLQRRPVGPHGLRSWLAGQRSEGGCFFRVVVHRGLHHTTGHGFARQISAAYSVIVRSLENLPELATFRMALRAHASWFAYSAVSRASASRYD